MRVIVLALTRRTGQYALVVGAADALVRTVRDALDQTIPAEFERVKRVWTRERDRVCQAIRLERMRNSLGLPWVTLSVYLDVYPAGRDRNQGLIPKFRRTTSVRGRDGGFGFNFRFDDSAEVIGEKTRALCDEMPVCLDYLDRTYSQEGFLAVTGDGYHFRRLDSLLLFQRREEVAVCLERMPWEPRPELWSAGWYGDLEVAEVVLLSYEFLGTQPSQRWVDMVTQTLAAINGKPSKPNTERHRRVVELLASTST